MTSAMQSSGICGPQDRRRAAPRALSATSNEHLSSEQEDMGEVGAR